MNKKSAIDAFMAAFFGKADEDLFNLIDDISHTVKISKKEPLFMEDDEGYCMYYLISGSAKLFKTNEEGKEAVIKFVAPGEIFAEIILYLKNKYPVTCMAIEPSELLAINAQKLFKLIQQRPELAMRLIGRLAFRSQYLVRMVENLTIANVRERFLNYLRLMQSKSGNNVIDLPVPKGDLALLLGIAPETFSRLLKKLTEDGIIEVEGRNIRIIGTDSL